MHGPLFLTARCILLLGLAPSPELAHISLDYPAPRVISSGSGPCGAGQGAETFSANPEAFAPGAQITIA